MTPIADISSGSPRWRLGFRLAFRFLFERGGRSARQFHREKTSGLPVKLAIVVPRLDFVAKEKGSAGPRSDVALQIGPRRLGQLGYIEQEDHRVLSQVRFLELGGVFDGRSKTLD